MAITITQLKPTDNERYTQFLLGRDSSLFYHTLKYRDFLRHLLGCEDEYLVASEGEAIRGVLPLMYLESSAGRVYNSLPYYGSNGGILADDEAAHEALVNAYNRVARRDDTRCSTIIEDPFEARQLGAVAHSHQDYRIGQFTRLAGEEAISDAELLGRYDSSARRNVKKARNQGVTVETGVQHLERIREIHVENMQAMGGLAKSDRFFAELERFFSEGQDFDVYVALKDRQVVAGVLLFYFHRTVEYYTPAVAAEFRPLQPLAAVLATAMGDACKRGFRWWNWGGTWASQTGVYRFKKKWAAEERKYYYYTQVNDQSILGWPRQRILQAFPGFFTVPFDALTRAVA